MSLRKLDLLIITAVCFGLGLTVGVTLSGHLSPEVIIRKILVPTVVYRDRIIEKHVSPKITVNDDRIQITETEGEVIVSLAPMPPVVAQKCPQPASIPVAAPTVEPEVTNSRQAQSEPIRDSLPKTVSRKWFTGVDLIGGMGTGNTGFAAQLNPANTSTVLVYQTKGPVYSLGALVNINEEFSLGYMKTSNDTQLYLFSYKLRFP